jgi:monoamine oxidase
MLQPVDGMDRIPYAFAKSLGDVVQYRSPVTEIRKTAKGVRVLYTRGGQTKQIEADYCVTTLPFSLLKKIPNDLSEPFRKVVEESTQGEACKVAWESRRFWEQDYNIYGGLSFLAEGMSPIWYPSARLMHPTGILVSGYLFQEDDTFRKLSLEGKFDLSRASVEKLHPGHGKELRNPVYCGWKHIVWSEGAWLNDYGGGPSGYEVILQPDGPIYFAGDAASHVVAWQEGAALSARRTVGMIADKVKMARLAGVSFGASLV